MSSTAIHIGADKGTILEAKKAILEILKVKREEETIRVALKVLTDIAAVNNTTIANCNITCT